MIHALSNYLNLISHSRYFSWSRYTPKISVDTHICVVIHTFSTTVGQFPLSTGGAVCPSLPSFGQLPSQNGGMLLFCAVFINDDGCRTTLDTMEDNDNMTNTTATPTITTPTSEAKSRQIATLRNSKESSTYKAEFKRYVSWCERNGLTKDDQGRWLTSNNIHSYYDNHVSQERAGNTNTIARIGNALQWYYHCRALSGTTRLACFWASVLHKSCIWSVR